LITLHTRDRSASYRLRDPDHITASRVHPLAAAAYLESQKVLQALEDVDHDDHDEVEAIQEWSIYATLDAERAYGYCAALLWDDETVPECVAVYREGGREARARLAEMSGVQGSTAEMLGEAMISDLTERTGWTRAELGRLLGTVTKEALDLLRVDNEAMSEALDFGSGRPTGG